MAIAYFNGIFFQQGGSDCAVAALCNAGLYVGRKPLEMTQLKDIGSGLCQHGTLLRKDCKAMITRFRLPLLPVDDENEVVKNGGILAIMHPIWNGHAVFVHPAKDGMIRVINSFLGPPDTVIGVNELERFYAPYNNFKPHYMLDLRK
jgi:hypothetical protein